MSIVLERAQEFFLRTCKVFAAQDDKSRDDGFGVYELRIHSQEFALRELISHSMLSESDVQLFNDAVSNFSIFSVVEVVIPSAVPFNYLERQFDCVKDAPVVPFFKEPAYKIVSGFALVIWLVRIRQLEHSKFATEDLS